MAGWVIVLVTVAAQIAMLLIFVESSEIDVSNDKIDLAYIWQCTRDQDECTYTSDLTWRGWLAFAVLMAAYLLKDTINGVKLILLSTKQRNNHKTRARYFIGGILLISVTLFTLYASTIYNAATATSK